MYWVFLKVHVHGGEKWWGLGNSWQRGVMMDLIKIHCNACIYIYEILKQEQNHKYPS